MFKKACPFCSETIDVRNLRKVPRTEKLRWYHITPAPRTACPKCGGRVLTSLENSPAILLLFGVPLLIIISSLFIREIKDTLECLPGGVTFLVVIIIPFSLWVAKRAKLIKDTS